MKSTTTFSIPSGQVLSRDVGGTYTRDGSKFTMHWQGAGTTTATLEGKTFKMNNEGMIFSYSR
jgi:hypothetical protein